jgi:hypothetical protein
VLGLYKNHKKKSDNSNSNGNNNDNNKISNDNDASSSSKYEEAFKTGSSIAKLIASKWNSQEKPGKVYVANRRVHHGMIGSAMRLSKYFKTSEPTITGVLSGIGDGLAKDDYADKKEWFKFKKKDDDGSASSVTTKSSASAPISPSYSPETSNTKNQQNGDNYNNKTRNNPSS